MIPAEPAKSEAAPELDQLRDVVTSEPVRTPAAPSHERGIGGNQHNIIRERIESVARELGFYAAREKQTGDGGKIDLAVEKSGRTIGCEISFMTTVDHEVGNVAKCIKAGCHHVAVICTDQTRLERIGKAVSGCLPADEISRVGFYLPDEFIAHLKDLAKKDTETPAQPEQETLALGKYRVKRRVSKMTLGEAKAQEDAAFKIIAETMKQRRPPRPEK